MAQHGYCQSCLVIASNSYNWNITTTSACKLHKIFQVWRIYYIFAEQINKNKFHYNSWQQALIHYTTLHHMAHFQTTVLRLTLCSTTLHTTTIHYIAPNHTTLQHTTPQHTPQHSLSRQSSNFNQENRWDFRGLICIANEKQ